MGVSLNEMDFLFPTDYNESSLWVFQMTDCNDAVDCKSDVLHTGWQLLKYISQRWKTKAQQVEFCCVR